MPEAVTMQGSEPLRLESAWRIPHGRSSAATVHPLRVIHGEGRRDAAEREDLRAMVAEIVREELRSELGRRMTGSIRRLVREEVARIFSRLGSR